MLPWAFCLVVKMSKSHIRVPGFDSWLLGMASCKSRPGSANWAPATDMRDLNCIPSGQLQPWPSPSCLGGIVGLNKDGCSRNSCPSVHLSVFLCLSNNSNLQTCQYLFQSGCKILLFPLAMVTFPIAPQPWQHLTLLVTSILATVLDL